MTSETTLTHDEQVFALRMLPHINAGKSFKDAARAVLDDDARIVEAFFDRTTSHFVSGVNERSHTTRVGVGDVICAEITKTVYDRLRA